MAPMRITVGDYVYEIRIYDGTNGPILGLEHKSVFAIDTETVKITEGKPIIPAFMQVCCHALRQIDVIPAYLIPKYLTEFYVANPEFTAVFHNAPFDLEVIGVREEFNKPMIQALQQNRVIDTGIRYLLHQLSIGRVAERWALDLVAKQMLGIEMDKDADLRLSFRPGMALTPRHLDYMCADAAVTAQLVEVMPQQYATEWHQLVGFIGLTDIGRRGMYVDRNYLQTLAREFGEKEQKNKEVLAVYGHYAGEPGNKKVLQSILQTVEYQLQQLENNPELRFMRTPRSGDIQITDESLSVLGNRSHPFIDAYKEAEHQHKILTTYLSEKLVHEDNRVHPVFTPLVKTGRTSCRKPNLQNMPRKESIRGIYIPTPGWLMYAADYAQLELCALAESCLVRFGISKMAEVINNDMDVHRWFAAKVVGKHALEDVLDDERQMAKACNFGFPGGLGIKTFQYHAKTSYGIDLPEDRCKELKQLWLDAFPEMEYHFKPAVDSAFSTDDETMYIAETITGRKRRNATFCSACNYQFQGLAADGARVALWYLWLEKFRMVNMVHDEVISELRDDNYLQQNVQRINQLMVYGMQQVIPHVKIKVEGTLMRRWYKEAKPVFDEQGNLLVWEPKAA